jgi:hypothetical protein
MQHSTEAVTATDQMIRTVIDEQIHADASHEAKVNWLQFLESSIHSLWNQGLTTVKPVFLMTADDLVQ